MKTVTIKDIQIKKNPPGSQSNIFTGQIHHNSDMQYTVHQLIDGKNCCT